MKRVMNLSPILTMLGLLFFCSFFSAAAFADTPDKTFVSRTTEIDGVKLHYTTGGHGPALILLHGYAETSRMWAPVLPLFGEKFTVIAPDLPGIGDSAIPGSGSDIKTAATRLPGLAPAPGLGNAKLVGPDIGRIVPQASPPQLPSEVAKLVVMDAF